MSVSCLGKIYHMFRNRGLDENSKVKDLEKGSATSAYKLNNTNLALKIIEVKNCRDNLLINNCSEAQKKHFTKTEGNRLQIAIKIRNKDSDGNSVSNDNEIKKTFPFLNASAASSGSMASCVSMPSSDSTVPTASITKENFRNIFSVQLGDNTYYRNSNASEYEAKRFNFPIPNGYFQLSIDENNKLIFPDWYELEYNFKRERGVSEVILSKLILSFNCFMEFEKKYPGSLACDSNTSIWMKSFPIEAKAKRDYMIAKREINESRNKGKNNGEKFVFPEIIILKLNKQFFGNEVESEISEKDDSLPSTSTNVVINNKEKVEGIKVSFSRKKTPLNSNEQPIAQGNKKMEFSQDLVDLQVKKMELEKEMKIIEKAGDKEKLEDIKCNLNNIEKEIIKKIKQEKKH